MRQAHPNGDYIYSGRNVPAPPFNDSLEPRQNRYSFHVHQSQSPNNAFANLRNEISNLRQQFSKLIQKDALNNGKNLSKQRMQREGKNFDVLRRQHRNQSHHQSEVRERSSTTSDVKPMFAFKSNEDHYYEKNKPKENISLEKKLQNLNEDIFPQRIFFNQTNVGHQLDVSHLKSEATKNVQEIEHQKSLLISVNKKLEEMIEKMKKQLQDRERIYEKKEEESKQTINSLQINLSNLNNAFSLKQGLLSQQNALLLEKEQEIFLLKQQFQKKIEFLKQENIKSENTISQLTAKVNQLQNQRQKHHQGRKQSAKIEDIGQINETEIIDLRKRVEAYKKSLENLNSTLNATREKLAQTREELKQTQKDYKTTQKVVKDLIEDNTIKQTLISSLYKDIGVLDKEMSQISHLKSEITKKSQEIDSLNEIIIGLRCSNLNLKYSLNPEFTI